MSAITPTATRSKSDRAPAPDGLLPPRAPKVRRRPVLIVVSVALVLFGALGGVWAWTASTSTVEVVATRTAITRGATISEQDLMLVRVSPDPALPVVVGERLGEVVGQRATTDLVAGGLLSPAQVTAVLPPASGMSVVGVSLAVGQLPGEELRPGDQVRLVQTPEAQADLADEPFAVAAEVLGVHQADTQVVVDVLVPSGQAPQVAARAGTGRVAVVLDARER